MAFFAQTIDELQEILAICPCCGELFRLVEGKLIFPQRKPKTCDYTALVSLENRASREDDRISRAEERFSDSLAEQRELLIARARRHAKRRLKKIDPVFSANDIDPQDVKLIFDPVEYVIFHGLCSDKGVKLIELVSREPTRRSEEVIVESIDKCVRRGDVEFETLYMKEGGLFEVRKVS